MRCRPSSCCFSSTSLPLIAVLYLSLTDYELGALDAGFVGLANFKKALADPVIRRSVSNTLLYVAIVLPGAVLLGLLVAVLVHGRKRTRGFYEVDHISCRSPRR